MCDEVTMKALWLKVAVVIGQSVWLSSCTVHRSVMMVETTARSCVLRIMFALRSCLEQIVAILVAFRYAEIVRCLL